MNEIIQGGSIVYSIIKNSQSVSNVGEIPYVNAIPNGASVEDMSGWKKTTCNLTSKYSTFVRSSLTNAPLFDIDININWYYDGRFKRTGSYISNANVSHVLKKCAFTLNFDLSASFGKPYNAGNSESVEAHLPFAITLHIVEKMLGLTTNEWIFQWIGEIGGEAAVDEQGNTIGWYSWEMTKIQ